MEENKIIKKITLAGVLGNVILTGFKFLAGIYGHSGAMISDAVHSLSDVFATMIAYLGTLISKRPADNEHPYGHERIECVASLILGLILLLTGAGIGKTGLERIFILDRDELTTPGIVALIAAIVSIVTKEGMFRYTMHYAKVLDSPAFMADAWHHRSDALSSIGSLLGIAGAMLGFPVLDSVASVIICVFIIKVSYDILKDALSKMMDTSCGPEYEKEICDFITGQDGVDGVDMVHTRMFGNKVYIDLEICVDGNMTIREGHDIAERVHDLLEENYKEVKHVMVHVNPTEEQHSDKE